MHGPEDEKYSLKGALTRVEVNRGPGGLGLQIWEGWRWANSDDIFEKPMGFFWKTTHNKNWSPEKEGMSPENQWLVQMYFLFSKKIPFLGDELTKSLVFGW